MKVGKFALIALPSLLLGIVFGWAGASGHANRTTLRRATVNHWMDGVMLLTGNGAHPKPLVPEQTQSEIRVGLNVDSMTLWGMYDTLPKATQRQLAFWIPATRVILATRYPDEIHIATNGLQVLVDCVQKARGGGESVRTCSAPALNEMQRRIHIQAPRHAGSSGAKEAPVKP